MAETKITEYLGTGRRKTAVARVRIKRGTGEFLVNEKPVNDFFTTIALRNFVQEPIRVTKAGKKYDIYANVTGGGITVGTRPQPAGPSALRGRVRPPRRSG